LRIALPVLFSRHPGLGLPETPRYANLYHFHGLEALRVSVRDAAPAG
jgi:unspecific monooxygenase